MTSAIQSLPEDVLHLVLQHLSVDAPSFLSFGATCRRFRACIRLYKGGGCAMRRVLSPDVWRSSRVGEGVGVCGDGNGGLVLEKMRAPGDAFLVFGEDITLFSSYWEVKIDVFEGRLLEIGVTTHHGLRHGSVERRSSWSFDCFGRVSLAGQRSVYGRQMQAGDVVGILFDVSEPQSITFFDNGISMGSLPVVPRDDGGLFPFVYMPHHPGEKCAVPRLHSRVPINIPMLRATEGTWMKPHGLKYDNKVIVLTWDERTWYALDVNPARTTVEELFDLMEVLHHHPVDLFELIAGGKRLDNSPDVTLEEAGICIDEKTGTHAIDILLSMPHVVS